MKKILFILLLLPAGLVSRACDACKKQQPEILRNVTHGAGPQSNWDYVIVWATVIIVLFTLFFSLKWLIRPGEKSREHIKRFILNNE